MKTEQEIKEVIKDLNNKIEEETKNNPTPHLNSIEQRLFGQRDAMEWVLDQ